MQMDKNLEKLLYNLEPEIDKKCLEIKQKRHEEKMQRLFILAILLFLTLPSLFVILNINIWVFIIETVVFVSLALIIMMPFEIRGECYE